MPIGLAPDLPGAAGHRRAELAHQGSGHRSAVWRFTAVFLVIFMVSERYHEKTRGGAAHQHLEQFNQRTAAEFDRGDARARQALPQAGGDPLARRTCSCSKRRSRRPIRTTTDVVVMTAKSVPSGMTVNQSDFDHYDQELMTAVVDPRRKHRQASQAADRAHQQPAVCGGQYGQDPRRAGADHGGLEHLHRRRAVGADRLLLDQRARAARRLPLDGAHPQPAARRVLSTWPAATASPRSASGRPGRSRSCVRRAWA